MNDKIISYIENKIAPFAAKLSNNRYLSSIKDAFDYITPFLIVGSFILLIFNLPFKDENSFLYIEWYDNFTAAFSGHFIQIFNVSMGLLSLFIAYGIGYSLAASYNLSSVTGGFLSLFAFLIISAKVSALSVSEDFAGIFLVEAASNINVLDARFLGAEGIFSAIIGGIISIEIYRSLVSKKMTIKLPDSVPPAIAKSFEIIIPIAVVGILFQIINIIIQKKLLMLTSKLIDNITSPLLSMSDSLALVIILLLIIHILWFVGIHGANVINAIISIITLSNLALNQAALQAGEAFPKVVAGEFFNVYVYIGGAGATLGLAIAMALSKNEHLKSIGRVSIIPGIFNINEPIMFGTPIVMNPILFIPFICVPIINAVIAYTVLKIGIVGKIIALVTWTTPGPLGALIASNFNIPAMVLSLCLVLLSYLIYTPFINAYAKTLQDN
ncbi:PTS sugar transporter subunit IIC [Brachyspira hampsonii]|uniref:Permease IIC component n=1 Tax=Brachyspira hampsonii TaxID=1287055 RepID=A0AAC9TV67_9SPIR|nr:PTS transporter subunit EIIC [Brachyspira hampsonii]ASJ22118.1 PTS chitobiose transporter subunit IIC [Brachyspira hampsonii]ELV05910.1 PTS system chitobiose-specific transporter subunit IIC [Brachyspira hampsonii 30599]MBW5379304.1 PTS sugar transporter subunit IIC [Brachyspira hampsonii]OEJ15553.1 PTS chitobiose transporter subunit IIC [Brachyspira hampsonii]